MIPTEQVTELKKVKRSSLRENFSWIHACSDGDE